jgi:nucleotide-binding universal stress UspA family protein
VTVLLAYVPTPQGTAALNAAIAETRLRNEELVVLNGTRGDAYDDPRFAQEAQVDTVKAELDAAGVQYSWRQEVGEDIVDAVLDLVTELEPSVLVIGLRKRSPTGKLFLGSKAQQLLLNAPCPVLAVKAA